MLINVGQWMAKSRHERYLAIVDTYMRRGHR